MCDEFYRVKFTMNAITPSESNGDTHVFILVLFFVTSVAIFGSRIRFLP
jgi:hypothetical protein